MASAVIALLVAIPVFALAVFAMQGDGAQWPHIIAYVLPQALKESFILLAGVGAIVMLVGTGTAWLVTAYEFPGRRILDWALLLPLAIPTYIIAYAYLDILHPIGPVQTILRSVLGYDSPRDLRLPDIRSMAGCIILLGFVLYPYVYLTTRTMFLMQAASLVEAAQTLGTPRSRIFWRVALPLARPAIAVGVSLALMETLNDIGASEFLGVRTLTVSIYTTWVTRSDLASAAQIALVMLGVILLLVLGERHARRHQRYATAAQRSRRMVPHQLSRPAGWLALMLGILPVMVGFIVPASYLVVESWKRVRFAGVSPDLLRETLNTVGLSLVATGITVLLGIVIVYGARLARSRVSDALARVASLGYAVPGTVLAIGLIGPLAAFDSLVDDGAQRFLGVSTGLLLLGSGGALVFAYVVRFLAMPVGGIEAGFSRISPSIDHASRTLGQTAMGTLLRVHLPISRAAIASAALLVFVDCMKELPATLLLRPLNFETLATHLYGEAARGTYEEAALAALLIVIVGLLPVILLARMGGNSAAEDI